MITNASSGKRKFKIERVIAIYHYIIRRCAGSKRLEIIDWSEVLITMAKLMQKIYRAQGLPAKKLLAADDPRYKEKLSPGMVTSFIADSGTLYGLVSSESTPHAMNLAIDQRNKETEGK